MGPPSSSVSKRRGAPRPRASRSRCYPPDFSRCPSRPSLRARRPRFRRGRARALVPRLLPAWCPSRASIGEPGTTSASVPHRDARPSLRVRRPRFSRGRVGLGLPPPGSSRRGAPPEPQSASPAPAGLLSSLSLAPGDGSAVFYRRGRQPRLLPAHPRNPVCANGVSKGGGALSYWQRVLGLSAP